MDHYYGLVDELIIMDCGLSLLLHYHYSVEIGGHGGLINETAQGQQHNRGMCACICVHVFMFTR